MPNRSKRKSLTHLIPRIIERDGGEWKCHYCNIGLIPPGTPEDAEPYYKLVMKKIAPLYGWGYFNFILDAEWESKAEAWQRGDLIIYDVYLCQSDAYDMPEVDHIIPLSRGGTNDISNLVVACRKCNQKKLDHTYEWFVQQIKRE